MNARTLKRLLILSFLLCIASTVILVVGRGWFTRPVADAGEEFMTALRQGDYNRAYAYCSRELQESLENPYALSIAVAANSIRPSDWTFSSRRVFDNEGELFGNVRYYEGHEGVVRLELVRVDDSWRVERFQLR